MGPGLRSLSPIEPKSWDGHVFQTRIHGRGGQGVVTAAEILSVAAFLDGYEAQAFPSFGSERMGAPVTAFCRIDTEPIRVREPVLTPDAVIVQDATLIHHVELFSGLAADGFVLINSNHSVEELGLVDLRTPERAERVIALPATAIARDVLGRPMPNTCLLGAFAALTGAVSLEGVNRALSERFPATVADRNIAAARAAYARLRVITEAIPHA